jgi:hypothetical protein
VRFSKLPLSWQQKLRKSNPEADAKAPVVYVGQTRLEADKRYENHLNGHKSSSVVRRFGKKLIVLDKWKPVLPTKASMKVAKAVYFLARRSRGKPETREAAVAALLREAGLYVHSA